MYLHVANANTNIRPILYTTFIDVISHIRNLHGLRDWMNHLMYRFNIIKPNNRSLYDIVIQVHYEEISDKLYVSGNVRCSGSNDVHNISKFVNINNVINDKYLDITDDLASLNDFDYMLDRYLGSM